MAEVFLEKEGLAFVKDEDSFRVFRLEGSRRVEIEDADSCARIALNGSVISKEKAIAMAMALPSAREVKP